MDRHHCYQCGEPFLATRSDQKFCSDAHRRAFNKAASRAAKKTPPPFSEDELPLAVTTTQELQPGWLRDPDDDWVHEKGYGSWD